LKGTGALYGFAAISDAAAHAEHGVRRSDPAETIAHGVDELISIIRRVKGYNTSKAPAAPACA
jgi:hypothetical protein